MSTVSRRALVAALLAGATGTCGSARADEIEDSLSPDYIERRRARRDASDTLTITLETLLPGASILWLVPPHFLVSNERRSCWNYVQAGVQGVRSAAFLRALTPSEVSTIARKSPDAICDPSGDWYAYKTTRRVPAKEKVLALPTPPTNAVVGMYRAAVPASVRARDFSPSVRGAQVRSLALIDRDGRFRVCLYAAYDVLTLEVRQVSRTLCDARWTLLARDDHSFSAEGTWCDGCAVPTLAEGVERVFGPFNMLRLATLPYPLLVSDVSSIESRTIELATFLEDGKFGRYLLSKVFIGCPSLTDAVKAASS